MYINIQFLFTVNPWKHCFPGFETHCVLSLVI